MKASGRLSVDTNAVITYRDCILTVCALVDEAIAIRSATVRLQLKKMGCPIPKMASGLLQHVWNLVPHPLLKRVTLTKFMV